MIKNQKPNINGLGADCLGIDCLGIVLAGGLSSRMGEDKAQLPHKKGNMLSFSQQLLHDAGINQVVISGNKHQVPDLMPNLGPVGGIYSVIKHYRPKAVLILPVDLPLMTASALKKLKLTGELSQKACFFQEHHIPLYLPNNGYLTLFFEQVFEQNFEQTIGQASKQEGHLPSLKRGPSVRAMLNQIPNKSIALNEITFNNQNVLFNTNTPQEWQQAQAKFS